MPFLKLPQRRSLRLPSHDYAQYGAYFVTIVVDDRACVLGEPVADGVMLSDIGGMVAEQWRLLEARFPTVQLDRSVVMPNHIHAILWLASVLDHGHAGDSVAERAATRAAPTTLGTVIGAFKSLTTVEYFRGVMRYEWPALAGRLWQRNYYDHVIRDDLDLQRRRVYVDENPWRWREDDDNPFKRP
jgi:putative transposase